MMADETIATKPEQGKKSGRGVSYPVMAIEEAIEKARAFHREERKSSAPVASAIKHFGYAETSSGGRQVVATLIQFGLMEAEGRSENRQVKLTDRALTILLDEPLSPDRLLALKECARMPKLYALLLAKWPTDLPSDHTIGFYLQKEFDFNPKTLKDFISDFRATLAFANQGTESIIPLSGQPTEGAGVTEVPSAMNEAGGVQTGSVLAKPGTATIGIQGLVPTVLVSSEWLRGRLSKGTSFRLIVEGEMGPREVGKLITLLEAQKSVLDDDDD